MPARGPTHESPDDLRGAPGLRVQFEPKEALIELVFVHGLPGGSRRTWSFSDDIATYWPKEWLPREPGFENVRIYTFEFDVSVADRRIDVARIQHFGRSLLDSIASDVHFRKTSQGLGNLRMVLNIHRACHTEHRPPSVDVDSNFAVIENINREFQQCYNDTVRVYSFFELQPTTKIGNVVVDKNSAQLAFANADPVPLMADHRRVACYENEDDPVYQHVRDRLGTTVDEIIGDLRDPERVQDQMRLLGSYLGVLENEEDELAKLMPVDGSCAWLTSNNEFLRWTGMLSANREGEMDMATRMNELYVHNTARNLQSNPSRLFWLSGAPGSGKSVLAAHVIRFLGDRNCSYYFLKHTDRSKQSLGLLLRSIAFQMASKDFALRQSLLSMQQEATFTAEVNDVRAIWKQVFLQKVFRAGLPQKQYWVIDALDEGIGGHELMDLIAKLPQHLNLKIFVTSRRDFHMEKMFKSIPMISHHIKVAETLADVRLFLESNRDSLHTDDAGVEDLIDQLVSMSQGSFLWIYLVLQRLEDVWDDKAIEKVLRKVPEGMNELYHHILEEMTRRPNKDLAKAILRWSICASRPLTVSELQDAIYRDTGSKVQVMERMIEDVCGQLITVDKKSNKVQLVHETARDFLLDHNLTSEFAVRKATAHSRLAEVCLQYLNEADRSNFVTGSQVLSPLDEYAHLFFSDHVMKGQPADSDITYSLVEFLDSSVLHWVEYVASVPDLNILTQTAKNLKAWVERRSDFQSPLSTELKFVQTWAIDLIRLVTVFGKNLLSDPTCISTVVPPLSPTTSNLYQRFGRSHLGLEVVGLADKGWADRIFSAPFHDDWTLSVACSEICYAVGLRSGAVIRYHTATCEELKTRLDHGEPVKHLEFSSLNRWLLVSSIHRMSLWNYETGELIWTVDVVSEAMALGFFQEDSVIISATRSNYIVFRNAHDATVTKRVFWHAGQGANAHIKQPMRVVMSTELGLVAVVYRNQPVLLLDLTNLHRPRYLVVESTVSALAFNAAQKSLAASFFHGELCTYSLSTLQKGPETKTDAHHLVASIDGRTLLAGDKFGRIHIYEFESLKLFHTVKAGEEDIMAIVFAPNSLRFLDVRRKEVNLWEPTSLVRRKDNEDSTSQGHTSFSTAPSELVQAYVSAESAPISAIAIHDRGEYVFCGKDDGVISVYDTLRGKPLKALCNHNKVSINFLEWNSAAGILISSDRSSLIKAHKVQQIQERGPAGTRSTWRTHLVFQKRIESTVRQIISSTSGEYLLVSDQSSYRLWTMGGEVILEHQYHHLEPTKTFLQRWTSHPRFKRRLFEIYSTGVHALEWSKDGCPTDTVDLATSDRTDRETRDNDVHFVKFADSLWAAYDSNPLSRPLVWESAHTNDPKLATQLALDHFTEAAPEVQSLIGLYQSQLVFLSNDDWICSMYISEWGQRSTYQRHFPIPHCWQSSSRRMITALSSKGEVIIVKGDELAIVKHGLASRQW